MAHSRNPLSLSIPPGRFQPVFQHGFLGSALLGSCGEPQAGRPPPRPPIWASLSLLFPAGRPRQPAPGTPMSTSGGPGPAWARGHPDSAAEAIGGTGPRQARSKSGRGGGRRAEAGPLSWGAPSGSAAAVARIVPWSWRDLGAPDGAGRGAAERVHGPFSRGSWGALP